MKKIVVWWQYLLPIDLLISTAIMWLAPDWRGAVLLGSSLQGCGRIGAGRFIPTCVGIIGCRMTYGCAAAYGINARFCQARAGSPEHALTAEFAFEADTVDGLHAAGGAADLSRSTLILNYILFHKPKMF